ncbi:MAG: signal peptidase II [Rhodospirillales bacterium]
MRPILLLALVVLLADQATKWLILTQVMTPPRVIEITGFFNLVLAYNRGVSFGLFAHDSAAMPFVLAGAALAISIGVLIWAWRQQRALTSFCAGLIVGGAIGNLIDRLRIGAVVDFLDFHAYGWHWPAFNLADSAIVTGVALLLYDGLRGAPRSTK